MASPPLVGTRPQRPRDPTHTRDSNALRASVLDAALELGVGTSRAVENLIFDSILEDDEVSIVLHAPFPCFLHPSCPRTLGLHHRAQRSEVVICDVDHKAVFPPLCSLPQVAQLRLESPDLPPLIAPVQSRDVCGAS